MKSKMMLVYKQKRLYIGGTGWDTILGSKCPTVPPLSHHFCGKRDTTFSLEKSLAVPPVPPFSNVVNDLYDFRGT
jgi:hypothetical protein